MKGFFEIIIYTIWFIFVSGRIFSTVVLWTFRRKEAQQKDFSICLQIIHLEFEEIFEIVIKNSKVGKEEKWGGLLGQISDNDRDRSHSE